MLSAVSLFHVLAHYTLCLPFIDAIINKARWACHQCDRPSQGVNTLKNYNDTCLINFIIDGLNGYYHTYEPCLEQI